MLEKPWFRGIFPPKIHPASGGWLDEFRCLGATTARRMPLRQRQRSGRRSGGNWGIKEPLWFGHSSPPIIGEIGEIGKFMVLISHKPTLGTLGNNGTIGHYEKSIVVHYHQGCYAPF